MVILAIDKYITKISTSYSKEVYVERFHVNIKMEYFRMKLHNLRSKQEPIQKCNPSLSRINPQATNPGKKADLRFELSKGNFLDESSSS